MLRKCFALLLSCGVAVLILEVGLRLLVPSEQSVEGPSAKQVRERLELSSQAKPEDAGQRFGLYGLVEASPHRDIVYRLKPNLVGTFKGKPITTNRYGQRQRTTPSIPKEAGRFRIVGVGDSHMFGWGVAQGETYLELLARQFAESDAGAAIETVNCAVPGYNTVMQAATYEHECSRFEPDLLLVHWIGNDFDFPHFLQPVQRSAVPGSPQSPAAPAASSTAGLLRHSALLRHLAAAIGGSDAAADALADELDPDALPELLPHSGGVSKEVRRAARRSVRHMVGAEAGLAALRRLAELAAADEVPVVLLILGTSGEARELVVEAAEASGIEVVNAAPQFAEALSAAGLAGTRAEFKARYTIPNDGHPSVEAHRQYAEVLQPVLARYLESTGGTP